MLRTFSKPIQGGGNSSFLKTFKNSLNMETKKYGIFFKGTSRVAVYTWWRDKAKAEQYNLKYADNPDFYEVREITD